MEAEKLCLTDGMVQYISAALLLATRPPRSKKNLLKNMKSKGKKATIAFFINHIHYSTCLLLYTTVCLGMQIQGRKLHNQDIAEERSLQQL